MIFFDHRTLEYDDVPGMRRAADGSAPVVVRHFVVGPIHTNCYAVVSDGEAMVVDPGAAGAEVARVLEGEGVRVTLVVATHGHGDHVGGVAALVRATGAKFAMCGLDVARARLAGHPGELGLAYDDDAPEPDRLLADGDHVGVGEASFRVIACPGHTPGGITLLGEGAARGLAFVGDTLFAGSAGRTDLAGGDGAALMRTLARLSREIPPETHLLCGHDADTTMSWELSHNPYLR